MFLDGTAAGIGPKSQPGAVQKAEMEQIHPMVAANNTFDSPLYGFLHIQHNLGYR